MTRTKSYKIFIGNKEKKILHFKSNSVTYPELPPIGDSSEEYSRKYIIFLFMDHLIYTFWPNIPTPQPTELPSSHISYVCIHYTVYSKKVPDFKLFTANTC